MRATKWNAVLRTQPACRRQPLRLRTAPNYHDLNLSARTATNSFLTTTRTRQASNHIHDHFSGAAVSGREFFRALSDIRGAMRRNKQGGAR